MPRVSVWLVRVALAHLLLGFTLGALLLAHKGVPIDARLWRLVPAHREILLVGWTVQLTIGVALWILPRFGVRPSPHGSTAAAWLVFVLLNTGVWLVAGGLDLAGRLAELVAALLFVASVWTRVRASGLSAM